MALRGTLKDFGIADILQLIGHQAKTGVLTLKTGDQTVDVHFVDGCVVRAESATRDRKDFLGRILVRAEVLSEDQVSRALDTQKRTLKRLGQLLVESGSIDRKVLATFTRLQTTETIYRLVFWTSGTYEFTQKEVDADVEFTPLKSETILMEGFRQLDEWPSIRRKVTGYGLLFERLKELDPLVPAAVPLGGDDRSVDDVFGEAGGGGDPTLRNIGQNERMVFQLITPERDVQKLIDLSRLGEFETCKALERLIDAGFVRALPLESARKPSAEATVGGISARTRARIVPVVGRAAVGVALLLGAFVTLRSFDARVLDVIGLRQPWGYADLSVQAELGTAHMQRIERALAAFEAVHGSYPQSLDELVAERLLAPRDLRYPWQQAYGYRRDGAGYELVRPLY